MFPRQYSYTCAITLFQGCVRYGTYRGIPPVLSVPGTSVSSVRHQYRYRRYRYGRLRYRYGRLYRCRYRYKIDTGTGYFGKFGTTSTRYQTLRLVRYDNSLVPPNCDIIPWKFRSTYPRTQRRTHPGPNPLQISTGGTFGIPRYRAFMGSARNLPE